MLESKINDSLKVIKIYPTQSMLYQARNEDFFRAGEVYENKGTSINI